MERTLVMINNLRWLMLMNNLRKIIQILNNLLAVQLAPDFGFQGSIHLSCSSPLLFFKTYEMKM